MSKSRRFWAEPSRGAEECPRSLPAQWQRTTRFMQAWPSWLSDALMQRHRCFPPARGVGWRPIAATADERSNASRYRCPECNQLWQSGATEVASSQTVGVCRRAYGAGAKPSC